MQRSDMMDFCTGQTHLEIGQFNSTMVEAKVRFQMIFKNIKILRNCRNISLCSLLCSGEIFFLIFPISHQISLSNLISYLVKMTGLQREEVEAEQSSFKHYSTVIVMAYKHNLQAVDFMLRSRLPLKSQQTGSASHN